MNKLLTALALILCTYGFSQQQYSTDSVTVSKNNPTDWELYIYNAEFKIEYKFVDCDPPMGYDQELILLKITNRTPNRLKFRWFMGLSYDGKCKTCGWTDEYTYEVAVGPNQAVEGSCDLYSDHQTKIFSAFIDANYTKGEKLTSFILEKLSVKNCTVN